MIYLGCFWGIMCVIFSFLAGLKGWADFFYDRFIRRLSKYRYKRIIEIAFEIKKAVEDNHGLFGSASLISGIIHGLIMYGVNKISITGIGSMILLFGICLSGIIDRYIYKDKKGKIKKWHCRLHIINGIIISIHIIF